MYSYSFDFVLEE